jgi:hypothetical protein
VTQSQSNGNPFPEKWTLVCLATERCPRLVEPRDTEDLARALFAALGMRANITSAFIIPPDGDGQIITLVGSRRRSQR